MNALEEIEKVFRDYHNDVIETESQIVDRIWEILKKTKFVTFELPSGRYFLAKIPHIISSISWKTEEWNSRMALQFVKNGELITAFTNLDVERLGYDVSKLEKIKNEIWFTTHVDEIVAQSIVGQVTPSGIELTFPENERFQGFIDYEDSAYSFETALESFKSLLRKHNALEGNWLIFKENNL